MAINSRLKCLLLTALFLYGLSAVQAQTASYYRDPNTGRFIQRLSWSGGMYARQCEIIIEKQEGEGYVGFLRQFTTENHFDISMQPGNYRFRIIPYDILDKPVAGTQWEPFTVFNAIKPEIYQPEDNLNYYNDKRGSKFEFRGKDIEPEAKVYFVSPQGEKIFPVEIYRYSDGSGVHLEFEKNQLVDGTYDVIIENPGGLETSIGDVEYRSYREKFGLMHYVIGASFMPAFQAYGENLGYGGPLYHISGRLGVISCMFINNYIGMEFSFSGFPKRQYEDVSDKIGFIMGYNLIFINWLPERKGAFNLRIGLGFDMRPMDLNYTTIGASFLYRLISNLYVEGGVNFSQPMKHSSTSDLQPYIGLTFFL